MPARLLVTIWQVWSLHKIAVRVSRRLLKGVAPVVYQVMDRVQIIACWLARGIALRFVVELTLSSFTTRTPSV